VFTSTPPRGFHVLLTCPPLQANPLNTYLSTKPSFASPEPLAAASGLTIPLKITLSDIKLSAIIILVFSTQKGLTLVFRNDPLESLKVSSTFDSIPFVRDYLQKEIEGQLRTLLMDEVPAIIHRLSLRLWVPEYRAWEDEELARKEKEGVDEHLTDPLASPPQDPVDLSGHVLDAAQIASLSLDSSAETHSLFSRKNLLRLAALTDSHRTLSLFTPHMQDVVFRAWAGPIERGEHSGLISPAGARHSPTLWKHFYGATTYTFSASSDAGSHGARPGTFNHTHSFFAGPTSSRHGKQGRKRKHRVVNLRKPGPSDSASCDGNLSAAASSAASEASFPQSAPAILEERDEELATPPESPERPRRSPEGKSPQELWDQTPRRPSRRKDMLDGASPSKAAADPSKLEGHETIRAPRRNLSYRYPPAKPEAGPSAAQADLSSPLLAAPFPYLESAPGGILEQAWMMKMAGEIARRVQEQKAADDGFWNGGGREESPPPAYGL
jgi:mitochondrial distribution and morphology protein 34